MIEDGIIRKARMEIGRLNRELASIHEDEERCKLRRSRAEAQKAKVQALIDQSDLIHRLRAIPDDPTAPVVRIEKLDCGANLVRIDKPAALAQQRELAAPERRRLKPDGIPAVSAMIVTALRDAGKASRPAEIADYVRKRWWPDLQTTTICAQVWQMAKVGKLIAHDGRYGLKNGSA